MGNLNKALTVEKIGQTVSHNMTADADYTLTSEQNLYGYLYITDTSIFLTVGRNIIVDNIAATLIVINSTLQDLTIKTTAGTGIVVPSGGTKTLVNDTVNVVEGLIYTKTEADTAFVEPVSYATSTVGGTVKARLDGATLYITIDGSTA